ncbi:MAG TPA: M56 family metallopeptidase [Panacibacter sp.]|nr:M56 family metallopeptidase [Panacibacter sp.]
MQTFLQSAFLQALGYAIANSLWQVALIWLIVLLVNNVGKPASSKKYVVGVIAQFTGFVWFIATLQFYYTRCNEALQQGHFADAVTSAAPLIAGSEVNSFSSALLYATIKTELLLPYLSVAYLFMLLFLSVRLTRAFYFTRAIRVKGLHKPDIEWRLFVKRTAAYLGINKEVKVYFSDLVKSPLTIGFLKPLILVPVASINHLSADQLEAILLHELAHIKRADYLINIVQSVIEIILFFNPFVQLLGKTIKNERENSCDDWVLQFQYNPAMYAEALLRIAYVQTGNVFAMNATGSNKSDLLPRVKRMLNQQEQTHRYRNQVFSLLLITIMLSSVAWLQPVAKNTTLAKNTTANQQKVVVEPLTASVDNPLFNPVYFFAKPIQKEIDKAVTIAQQKIEAAAPDIEDAANTVVATVTPMALQKLQDLGVAFGDAFASATDKSIIEKENNDATTNEFDFSDTMNLSNSIRDLVQKEVAKTDWKKIGTDLSKIEVNLEDLKKDKSWTDASAQITNTIGQAFVQLTQLKTEKKEALKQSAAAILQQENNAKKINDATKKLEKSLENQKRKINNAIQEKLKLLIAPQPEDEDKTDAAKAPLHSRIPSVYTPEISQVYTAAAYNNYDYSYNFQDRIAVPDSAIIVVKHNPDNDHSHIKHITVAITGNNGETKTYEFTVEVYQ